MFKSELQRIVDSADRLAKSFRDVVVHGDKAEPFVMAKDHFRGPGPSYCRHALQRTAVNIHAVLVIDEESGFAEFGDPAKRESLALNSLRTCCRCDKIINYELA